MTAMRSGVRRRRHCAATAMLALLWLAAALDADVAISASDRPVTDSDIQAWLAPGRTAALEQHDFSAARTLTTQALLEAQRRPPTPNRAQAYLLNDLARWSHAAGDQAAARQQADEALGIARQVFADKPAKSPTSRATPPFFSSRQVSARERLRSSAPPSNRSR